MTDRWKDGWMEAFTIFPMLCSLPAGYILYCNIFIIKPYNIGHTDLDVFVCKSFCHIDIIIQV